LSRSTARIRMGADSLFINANATMRRVCLLRIGGWPTGGTIDTREAKSRARIWRSSRRSRILDGAYFAASCDFLALCDHLQSYVPIWMLQNRECDRTLRRSLSVMKTIDYKNTAQFGLIFLTFAFRKTQIQGR